MNFNLFSNLKFLIKELTDLIYKRKCIECSCSINEGILCKTCSKDVQNLRCFEQGILNGYRLFSAYYYKGAVKTLIQELKFKHNKSCAYYAAKYLDDFIKEIKENTNIEINFKDAVIIPVLTHKKNKNKRGFDNVYEIARKLSELTGFRLNSTSLIKKEYREPQYKLSAKQRKKNPEGSFKLNENFSEDNLIILLDDIVTTGSTLDYITSLFKERGIKNLICITLAKTKHN